MNPIASPSPVTQHILYADPSESCRDLLIHMLERSGCVVKAASTIVDSLSLIRLERFDLFIIENRFADGEGTTLCRLIRAVDQETPIVFFSSSARASDQRAGLAAGAQAYLTKPMGIYVIEQTIVDLLARPVAVRAYV